MDTVGNSQKSGISHGCGYEDSPPPGFSSRRKIFQFLRAQPAFQKRACVDTWRRVPLKVHGVAFKIFASGTEKVVETPTS